ncbi:MAG: ATP-binding protein [Pseudomonadota bacterium]
MPSSQFPMAPSIRQSLRFRIVSMLLLCTIGLSLISILYTYFSQRQQLQQKLEQNTDNIVHRLAFTMSQPLWNFDQFYLQQLEDQELKDPSVISVFVVSHDDSLKVGRCKAKNDSAGATPQSLSSFTQHHDALPGEFHHEQPILYDSETIGMVHVTVSDTQLRRQLHSLMLQQTQQGLLILIGISLLTYTGLSRIVLSPLRELYQAAAAYGNKDLTVRTRITSNDEIGLLAATLNQMAAQLSTTIDELEQTENTLRATNRQLHDIIEFIPDALFVTDPEGILIAWNRAIAEMTGVPSEQMLGKGDQEYARPFYGERRPILIDLLDLTDTVIDESYQSVRRIDNKLYAESFIPAMNNRENIYLWGVAAPLYDNEGRRCGAIEIIRDVTEQKQAEKTLQENAEFRKRVFDSSQMPIVIMDAETFRFIDCNPAATQIYRLESRESTLGKTPLDVSAPLQYDGTPSTEKARMYIDKAIREERVIFEWKHQRPDGEVWDAEVQLMSFRSRDRQLLQFTLQDITERKKTAALMMQTEKMMMVGGLAAGMAHEINNPLGIITQAAQIVQRRLSPSLPANQEAARPFNLDLEQVHQYLETRQVNHFIKAIREATERAAKIIANMLKFSRKSQSLVEWVDLRQLFEQVLELAASDYDLKKEYDFRRIDIVKEFSSDLPKVPVTVLEIEQVLLNLLKNAAQAIYEAHTPAPKIILRSRRQNDFAIIEIEDNGPGIAPAVQKRIFEPFYTTKSVGQGTGLGLSVSYAIITTNHHGQIEVSSQIGQGSCFTIRLPLKQRNEKKSGA